MEFFLKISGNVSPESTAEVAFSMVGKHEGEASDLYQRRPSKQSLLEQA